MEEIFFSKITKVRKEESSGVRYANHCVRGKYALLVLSMWFEKRVRSFCGFARARVREEKKALEERKGKS